jgi:outer membrane protein TolC
MIRTGFVLVLLALSALAAPPVHGQQLTLEAAMRQADRSAYANRIATGNADAQAAQAIAPLKGILPSAHLETGYVRTTDPIGAFGTKLRQRSITQADFDPRSLNYPAAIGNYQSGAVVELPLVNADAWAGRTAARRGADASRESATWTRLSTRVDVVRAYYGAVLAGERATTLTAAARAAHAHVSQAEAMVRQGMATRSDALLASVRAGDIDAQLAEAQGGVATARQQLATVLGLPQTNAANALAAPSALPSAERIRAVVAADTAIESVQPRADVLAAKQGLAAARADAVRARAAYLPRINSFARYDWNAPNRPYTGDRNWTVGVMASWSPFGGASELSDLRATAGRSEAARAQADAAQANAALDVAQTRTALAVALTRLAIAERSAAQSAEAHRIVSRKYEGGLATVVELLDAQAAEVQSALALSQARYGAIVAAAERRRAVGGDPATLAALDAPDGTTPTASTPAAPAPVAPGGR